MPSDNVQIEGLEQLVRAFEQFPERMGDEVARAIDSSLFLLQTKLAVYPAAIPGSRYERTGTLGRLWTSASHTVKRIGSHFYEGSVGNATPGGRYVQSEAMQVPVHQGRWQTAEEVIEESRGQIDRLLQEAGERAVGGVARMVR